MVQHNELVYHPSEGLKIGESAPNNAKSYDELPVLFDVDEDEEKITWASSRVLINDSFELGTRATAGKFQARVFKSVKLALPLMPLFITCNRGGAKQKAVAIFGIGFKFDEAGHDYLFQLYGAGLKDTQAEALEDALNIRHFLKGDSITVHGIKTKVWERCELLV